MVAQSSTCLLKPQVQVPAQTPEEGVRTHRATRDTRGLSRWPETKKTAPSGPLFRLCCHCSGLFWFIPRTLFRFPDILVCCVSSEMSPIEKGLISDLLLGVGGGSPCTGAIQACPPASPLGKNQFVLMCCQLHGSERARVTASRTALRGLRAIFGFRTFVQNTDDGSPLRP